MPRPRSTLLAPEAVATALVLLVAGLVWVEPLAWVLAGACAGFALSGSA